MDPDYCRRCFEENLRPIAEDYFGARLIDPDNFPLAEVGRRPIIVVANHSGMGLSWDNIILDFLLYDLMRAQVGAQQAIAQKAVRLVDPLFISHVTVAPFGLRGWWSRIGCVAATSANFEQAMAARRIVIVSPEGVAGISKGAGRRYRLQRFSSSFLRMAHAHGALVVPVSVVNGEYLNPLNVSWSWLNRIGRWFGFPFVPVGTGMLQALIPAAYLNPRPARLTYVVHEPVDFDVDPLRSHDQLTAEAETFRQAHQIRLDAAVKTYDLPRAQTAKPGRSPFFWHEMFLKTAGDSAWLAILYKIPLGYPLIWLARRIARRRPT